MSKYVVKKTKSEKFHFNLVASNGEPILTSQVYASKKTALTGIKSVQTNAPIAEVSDTTAKEPVPVKNPKFEIFKGKDGKDYFRLIAKNGQAIGRSEGYSSLSACKKGIESVRKNSGAEVTFQEE